MRITHKSDYEINFESEKHDSIDFILKNGVLNIESCDSYESVSISMPIELAKELGEWLLNLSNQPTGANRE